MKNNIGFDLDGVLADFHQPFYKFILDCRDDIHFNYEDITAWDWSEQIKNLTSEEFWELFDRFTVEHGYLNLPPISMDSFEVLNYLNEEGHPIYFITGRPAKSREETYEWMSQFFDVRYDNIIHTDNKSEICKKLKIKFFVEDTPHYALDIANNSPTKVYLLDKHYNEDFEHDKITRIYDLHEVLTHEKYFTFRDYIRKRYGLQ